MVRNVPLELVHKQRFSFLATSFVSDGVFDFHLIKSSAIVEFDTNCIADGAFRRFMVVNAEAFVLYTINLGAEYIDTRVGGRLVGALEGKVNFGVKCKHDSGHTSFARLTRRKSEGKQPCS